MQLVTVDIGGTHARFALATVGGDGAVTLGEAVTLRTAEHTTFLDAWREFARRKHEEGRGALPRAAAISVAAPVAVEVIRLVNNPWTIDRATVRQEIGVDEIVIINDFGAVGHAVARVGADSLAHLAGPDAPLPEEGTISILGPGTGLGVAHVYRDGKGGYRVQSTEGGHFSFGPIDVIDDALIARLRQRHGRVSAERVVSGPAIVDIHSVLAGREWMDGDKALWDLALSGEDPVATAAMEHFCCQLGAVAGDVALVQGGVAVVVAGGLGLRLKDVLARSRFGEFFRAKGRFSAIMAGMPVKLITHPQPGLFGAAAAFATEHES